jgi:aminopeptidase-like protein
MSSPMHDLARRLFPICRSITGDGVRETLRILREHLPELRIVEVPSGTQCFDWEVPEEWNITEARLIAPDGEVLADFAVNNLHVMSYSVPVDSEFSLEELQPHLHSLPDQPDAIPYLTSYYKRDWAFCLSHNVREKMKPGKYRAVIKSAHTQGSLTYGELVLPGSTTEEVLLSTYVCHPSMGNNELSGPVVATFLAKHLEQMVDRRLTYRIVFIPETIGSIVYLSRHLEHLKKHVIAGFVLSCVGDDLSYSYLASRKADTLADRVAKHALQNLHPGYQSYSYLRRGSDERNYCWPGVDLPVCSIMRTKYGAFPEYHTSLDDLSFISEAGLQGALGVYTRVMECLEANATYVTTSIGEPQLGKRGLYHARTMKGRSFASRQLVDILAYSDGTVDLIGLAEALGRPLWEIKPAVDVLAEAGLLHKV